MLIHLLIFSLYFTRNFSVGREIPVLRQSENDEVVLEDDNLPGEPMNPSEFELLKNIGKDNRQHGSEVYLHEIFRERLTPKNGLQGIHYRWPKIGQYVVIPYLISTRFDQKKRLFILQAFEDFHKSTCIRFVPRVDQKDYIFIIYGSGCDSDAGRVGGEQAVSLGKDCDYTDIAIHELNHAVGFWHEQNRADRDDYVKIFIQNVLPENRFNFDKMSLNTIQTFGQKYDTDSIMHYDKWAFSVDYGKKPVMEPKIPNDNMGLARELSKTDIKKINLMYKCNVGKTNYGKSKRKSPILPEPLDGCTNFHSNCTNFMERRGCENIWMKANCRDSCGLCGENCEDLREECLGWSLKGACQEHSEYMSLYCRKSCLKC